MKDGERDIQDPLAGSAWSQAGTVEGFVRSEPNATLMELAAQESADRGGRLLDIGCGAARNAVPLSRLGWQVFGTDLSVPMLGAAERRALEEPPENRPHFVLAPMETLPFASATFDFIVAHGIWNLARSGAEFRAAVAEARRVARPRCTLFLFTFSRHAIADSAEPVPGESFVFTQFSGAPQCFLTEEQVLSELGAHGFAPDQRLPLRELNRRRKGELIAGSAPVIYEGLFRLH